MSIDHKNVVLVSGGQQGFSHTYTCIHSSPPIQAGKTDSYPRDHQENPETRSLLNPIFPSQ